MGLLDKIIPISYENIKKIISQMEKCICRINYSVNNGFCQITGFFCRIPFPDKNHMLKVLITSELINQVGDNNFSISLKSDEEKGIKRLMNLKNRLKYSQEKNGIAIIEIYEQDNIENYLDLDDILLSDILNNSNNNVIYKENQIYLIQYINAELCLSIGMLNGISEDERYIFHHSCSTKNGSIGSPILGINNKLIGIHTGSLKNVNFNLGTFLSYPIKEFIHQHFGIKEKNSINNTDLDNLNIKLLLDDFNKEYLTDIKYNKLDEIYLNSKNLGNLGLIKLSKIGFKNIQKLDLSHNHIKEMKILENFIFEELKILILSHNNISDINILEKIKLFNLKELDFYENNISDIKVLEKVNFSKIESLNLGCNKVSDISILKNTNFKELKNLNLFCNNISDIQVLAYVNFKKLEILNLGCNNIKDINVLEKTDFKELKRLYLYINYISDINVFDKIKFGKLEELSLCENNINNRIYETELTIENLGNKIKNFETNHEFNINSFSSMAIGIILDVSKDILSELIKFNNEKNFFDTFLHEYEGEIVTLLNGNNEIKYFNINELLLSTINCIRNGIFIPSKSKKKLFEEKSIYNIIDNMKERKNLIEFINSKTAYYNYSTLHRILNESYNQYTPNLFEYFDKYIKKPSLLNIPLKNIFENLKKNISKNKYIIIISDGNLNQSSEDMNNLLKECQENNISIITLLLSDKKIIKNVIYGKFPNNLNLNFKILFDISSKVDYRNPLAHYCIKQNYEFPNNGEGHLFFETNLDRLSDKNSINNINNIKYEGIDIKIDKTNYQDLEFKFRFTKNQVFGTCWANAYSGAILLTNKRILGRKTETFETYRENIIKFASNKNVDGGYIKDNKVKNFFETKKLHFKDRNKSEAIKAVQKGRFIIFSFRLNDKQWDNFSNFYKSQKIGILTATDLNNGCEINNENECIPSGHAVLLLDVKEGYSLFLNSWGADWGDGGKFRVEDPNILKPYNTNDLPKFHDVFFYENELTKEEKLYYANNVMYIRGLINDLGEMTIEKIRNHINDLNNFLNNFEYICEICENITKIKNHKPKIENGIYSIICPFCGETQIAEGKLKELLILENLFYDGNEDFDINFKEKYYLHIDRIEFHKKFEKYLPNKSDWCFIGAENSYEKKN